MSTTLQQYSLQNQADYIAQYAKARGFQIVRTYADPGRSGLSLRNRPALQQLLVDIESGKADYDVVLVYDISRWGRFQDPDEAGSYELRCRIAGVDVHYCAEKFDNDGSPGAAIFKAVKRIMAGEYSRELSLKVHAGQVRLVLSGFHVGGSPGYGLRRQLISANGEKCRPLLPGERKSLTTDRVTLVPGPPDEVRTIRLIYQTYLKTRRTGEVARLLNERGCLRHGVAWDNDGIRDILRSERYIGTNTWNRTSFKLSTPSVKNPKEQWVRAENSFDPIISASTFKRVQTILDTRAERYDREQMLAKLSKLYAEKGYLTSALIDNCEYCKNTSAYRCVFGSLIDAYRLVGYRRARSAPLKRSSHNYIPHLVNLAKQVRDVTVGAHAKMTLDRARRSLILHGMHPLGIAALPQQQISSGPVWFFRGSQRLAGMPCIVLRMDSSDIQARDYLWFPGTSEKRTSLTLREGEAAAGATVYPDVESLLGADRLKEFRSLCLREDR